MAYYTLTEFGWEHENKYILEGPEVENWETFVRSFEQKAVELALSKAKEEWKSYKADTSKEFPYKTLSFIQVVDELLLLLEQNSYKVITFPDKSYCSNYKVVLSKYGLSLD